MHHWQILSGISYTLCVTCCKYVICCLRVCIIGCMMLGCNDLHKNTKPTVASCTACYYTTHYQILILILSPKIQYELLQTSLLLLLSVWDNRVLISPIIITCIIRVLTHPAQNVKTNHRKCLRNNDAHRQMLNILLWTPVHIIILTTI